MQRLSLLGRTWVSAWFIAMIPLISHAQTFTTLAVFSGSNGDGPNGPLLQGTDGNFYGTTLAGGAFRNGTVFKMTPSGALTVLHSFSDSDGSTPEAPLIQASDGNFYGTTYTGGMGDSFCQLNFIGCGTVFKITPTSAETVLYTFQTQAGNPTAGLVQGKDGNFYGITYFYGIFRLTPSGAFTALATLPNALTVGDQPSALIEATDGNFYGATSDGVFKVTSSGALTTLAMFPANSGRASALVQGTDGNFYGTTSTGGVNKAGSVFRVSPAGTLTILYSFTAAGGTPSSALIQGADGDFYGTTAGVLYRITSAGVISILHTFNAGDNANGLIQGVDGNLYGTTFTGGGQLVSCLR